MGGYTPNTMDNITQCVANIGYNGECDEIVTFHGLAEKQDFARQCKTSWRCKDASFVARKPATPHAAFAGKATSNPYPQLNLHVEEPEDSVEQMRLTQNQRARSRELLDLERKATQHRMHLANSMSGIASMLESLVTTVREIRGA